SIEPDYRGVGIRIFTARIKRLIERSLDQLGYPRIDVRAISASWIATPQNEPLRVIYPGFGIPVYLAPSPGPQLIEALIATGEDRIYASATSFMAGYRTALDGVEASIVVAKALNGSLEQLMGDSRQTLSYVCSGLGLEASLVDLPIREYQWDQVEN